MRADVPALVALADNRRIADMLAVLPHPYTRADGIAFVEIMARQQRLRPYAITLLGGAFIGIVSLGFEAWHPPELGCWLGEPYWGKGLATEAAGALVDAARSTGLFPAIRATAKVHNHASARVLIKIGLVKTGEAPGGRGSDAGMPVAAFALGESP